MHLTFYAAPSLGDCFRSLAHAVNICRTTGQTIELDPININGDATKRILEVLDLLDIPDVRNKITIDKSQPKQMYFIEDVPASEFYPTGWYLPAHIWLPPLPTKKRWNSGSYNKITYQFEGMWNNENKRPSTPDQILFLEFCKQAGIRTVQLSSKLSLKECVNELSTSDMFVGICSGMAQVAYSVGTPTYLIRNDQLENALHIWHRHNPKQIYHTLKSFLRFGPLSKTPNKKVVVYAIAKNEEKFVDKFMISAQEADQVVILDTGSTDKTVELFKAWGATVYEQEVKPWRFDKARNLSLDLVPKDTDICVNFDIDEVLPVGWRTKVEDAWQGDVNRIKYLYIWKSNPDGTPDTFFAYSKIHSRHGYHWKFPAHEYLFANEGFQERTKTIPEFKVLHYPDDSKPRAYYLDLLKLGVEENPDSDRAAFYYGRELLVNSKHVEAIAELQRYLSMPSAKWKDERSKAMYFIAAAYLALKKREDVVPWLMRSIAEQPGIRDTWLSLAEEYYDNENYLGAYHAVIEALKIKSCSASYATNGSSWSAYPHEVASVCAYHLNLKENARRHLENALMYEPANKDYLEKKRMLDMEQAPVSLILPKRKSCLRNGIIERVA